AATGEQQYHQKLMEWFPDPTNPATFRWGWWRLFLSYGNAVRNYAFAVRSGRLQAHQVNAAYLTKCEAVVLAAGDDMVKWSKQNAYGTSFPEDTKRVTGAGWYFSGEQTFDLAAAYQITPKADYMTAILANMNFEGGCNPVNISYVTGMGWKRERDAVSQYAANDRRVMPPTGEPIGNIQWGFSYLNNYGSALNALVFPSDNATVAPHPFYDRWADSWNVSTEFVTFLQARSLATYAFVAAQTSLKTQPWKSAPGQIIVPSGTLSGPITFSLQAAGLDLSNARIVWETRDGDPYLGQTFTFTPKNNGSQWIEAEAQLPDGRRVFAATTFNGVSANVVWVDDALPVGANPGSDGGDSWSWISSSPSPTSGSVAHQSGIASGTHQHFFKDATATMPVSTGSILYAYIYLDPANPPGEVMLQWYDGNSWEHRAYWGANEINYGIDGTAARKNMGALPAAGQWVQLKVPASVVGLEGKVVTGMGFTLNGGRATWDAAGLINPAVTNPTVPTVSITGLDGSVVGGNPGKFTFTRTGDTSSALSVNYSLNGTSENEVQVSAIPGAPTVAQVIAVPAVTIPAGATSATLNVAPNAPSPQIADSTTVVLSVTANSNYTVAAPGNATLTIAGNTVAKPSLKLNASGPSLSWASTVGASYRIAFKNGLGDPTWTYLPNTVTATGAVTSWTDTDKASQRFYLIIRTQ
ncbi:MAG: glycoside hydrolase family 9 protein, partial [Akkermansiaceae bacterium]|nr:glycoside hydrolase family 9 protein [Verrucomicrobiales bacterium]